MPRRSRSRSPKRDRERRSRSRERRRHRRSRSRSPKRRSRSPRPRSRERHRSRSPRNKRERKEKDREDSKSQDKQQYQRPEVSGEDLVGLTEEEAEMRKIMGFGNFDTTKGKKVGGNEVYSANVPKKRRYRQYMNRRGGFNRPLDFIA